MLLKRFGLKRVDGDDHRWGDRLHEADDVERQDVARRVNFDEFSIGCFEFLGSRLPIRLIEIPRPA